MGAVTGPCLWLAIACAADHPAGAAWLCWPFNGAVMSWRVSGGDWLVDGQIRAD